MSFMLYNQLREPRPTPQPNIPVKIIPTAVMQANHFSIHLPVILLSKPEPMPVPVSVPEPIWKVTKIINLGYELGGQRYDLAAFTRIDDQATGQGYCINPGWAIPELGTEYLLNAEGIFVPVYEPDAYPLQRFLKIPNE
jgi:hypothetical protein